MAENALAFLQQERVEPYGKRLSELSINGDPGQPFKPSLISDNQQS
jgi:hypothetical protein